MLALALAGPSGAVIIDSGDGTGNTSAPPDDPGWDYVGLRGGLGAIYLGNGWVVTANHVLEGEVILGGIVYPAVSGSKIQIDDGMGNLADLAVFRIDPAPAWPLLPISAVADISGADVTMIGFGRDRAGATSGCVPPRSGWLWAGTWAKRWGENVVTAYGSAIGTDAFYTTFDKVGRTHEAQGANGDSGGAVFVKNGGQWELAGVMFAIGTLGGCQPPDSSLYTNTTWVVDLADYRDQILPIVRPQCSDELDNDGDLLVDYPADPDCNSAFDDREKTDAVPSASLATRGLLAGLLLGAGILVGRRRR